MRQGAQSLDWRPCPKKILPRQLRLVGNIASVRAFGRLISPLQRNGFRGRYFRFERAAARFESVGHRLAFSGPGTHGDRGFPGEQFAEAVDCFFGDIVMTCVPRAARGSHDTNPFWMREQFDLSRPVQNKA